MPSFFAFLRTVLLLLALFYGTLLALDILVDPVPERTSVRVPTSTFIQPE